MAEKLEPLVVVDPVDDPCEVRDDRIPKDLVLSNIYANEDDEEDRAHVGLP